MSGAARHAESPRQRLERQIRLYRMLSRINRAIVRERNPYELYETLCRIAVEEGRLAFAWVGLADPVGGRLTPVARAGAVPDLSAERPLVGGGSDPAGTAVGEDRLCVVNDLAAATDSDAWATAMAEGGIGALAAVPLRLEGRCIGVLVTGAGEAGYFRSEEIQLLTEMADDVSFALDGMRREEQRAVAETKIQYLAYYDPQTGLPGGVLFGERLAAACKAAAGKELAVMVVTLRNYHGILQVLGQAAGFLLARTVAERLERLRPTTVVGRLSESEFALFVEGGDALHLVEETAWQVHGALARAIAVEGQEVFLNPFVGIALSPRDGDAAVSLKAARIAATVDTQDNGSCCRFFVADMDLNQRRRLDLEATLRRAVDGGEFILHYQPQVDLATGLIVGVEALLRWDRPGQGLVPPADFIALLEGTGLIVPVGRWVVEEACRQGRRWQDAGLPPVRVAVNLSARQFQEGDVGSLVRQALAAAALEPRWLELEITESVVLLNAETVIRTLDELKAIGVTHALDDFGTGYSSLSYLQRLPVSRLKVDRSFVAHITSEPSDAAIVRAVVGMAHSLGLKVIAEGVESEGQLGYLRGLGCDEMQGYYCSRPLPPAGIAALLEEGRALVPPAADGAPERVLLAVDDEPHILSALRRLLRGSGIRVLAATTAQEGFQLLATQAVGVVLCDQRMPEMTGTEFLRRVRDLYPAIVRIVFSGYTELNSILDAVNRGAVYKFITKPWEDKALVDSLLDAFRMHEMERENRELSQRLQAILAQPPEAGG